MNYFWGTLGWIWSRKLFFLSILISAALFFVLLFPFSDLSDVVTSKVAQATNGQVYLQFDELDLHLVPQPAISATNLSVETTMPALKAKWAKFTPNLFSLLFSLPTMIKASNGDPEAGRAMTSKLGARIAAEGLLGGDLDLNFQPGSKSEQGHDRSRISLALDKMNLTDVQKWSDLPVKLQGQFSLDSDVQLPLDFTDQPEGEYSVRIKKFALPAGSVMVPFNGAMMPMNFPNLTLANVLLKGRIVGGRFFIEEGTFGDAKDPVYGRIKGNMALRFQAMGANIVPLFGAYDLTLELTTTQLIEKELGIAFIMLGPGKNATPGGGAHYLVRMMGQGVGMEYVPNITRATSF